MPTTIGDLVAAVQATNAVIKDPSATQKDLEAGRRGRKRRPSRPTSKNPTPAPRWRRRRRPSRLTPPGTTD